MFKIDKNTKNPDGGEIFRDISGNPTGIFNETAQGKIKPPSYSFDEQIKALKLANRHALENGITSFHDAGSDFNDIKAYKTLSENNELDIRLYVMLNGRNDSLLQYYYNNGPEIGLYDNHLTIRSIKLYPNCSCKTWPLFLVTLPATIAGTATLTIMLHLIQKSH